MADGVIIVVGDLVEHSSMRHNTTSLILNEQYFLRTKNNNNYIDDDDDDDNDDHSLSTPKHTNLRSSIVRSSEQKSEFIFVNQKTKLTSQLAIASKIPTYYIDTRVYPYM